MPVVEMRLPWTRSPLPAAATRVRRRRAGRIALAVAAALTVFALAFDWDWCRPLLKHYVESHSGRRFDCARLQVRFDGAPDPTITLTDVRIANAPWAAAQQPFLQARRISATVAWRSLWDPLVIVPLVVLEDAQVDMERQADGLRNWRLTRPDDRGPPRVRVLALDARNSRLHLVHRGIGLEMDAQSTPLAAAQALAGHPELPLVQRLQFKGMFKERAFDGDAQASARLFFGATPKFAGFFALRGAARFAGWRVEAAGVGNDLHAAGDFDVDVRVASDAALTRPPWPLPDALARLRPLAAQGHLTKTGDTWRGTGLRAALGQRTRLEGDASFTGSWRDDGPRRRVQATLRDATLDVDDLSALRGRAAPGEAPAPGQRADEDHAWSTAPLDFAPLRSVDGEVVLERARLVGAERGFAQSLRGRASLEAGVLQLRDLDLGLAGGHVLGALRLDATQQPAALSLDARWRGLRLEQLSSTLAGNGGLAGAVDGQATLATRGGSTLALVANAGGRATLKLADGATVSKRLDAKLGLDGGAWLRSLFDKSGRVPVACGELGLALAHGVASSTRFVFETADTALAGHGSADLARQTLDLQVTATHRRLALLSLDKAIRAEGSWHAPRLSLEPADAPPPTRCATR
jgi:hypothetical protein